MSQTNHTPIPFWLSLPLPEFAKWIKESNQIIAKNNPANM